MKRGVIDAFQLSTPASDLSLAMNEVVKYIYLSAERQPSEYHAYLFNKDVWAKLPDDLKGLIEECTLAECDRFMALMSKLDKEAVDKYKAYGVGVATIPKDIEDEVIKQADIFYKEESAKDPFFAKVYQSQRDFQKSIRSTFSRL
jgi:TRAP-type mannitol/chloroaromatic compound transport system substrate-binding protein